jgi:eukaryotic-like serine/threonine-protein kinase
MTSGELFGRDLGRYRIVSLLGRGGMGAVYCALDPTLDRRVALKILPPELSTHGDRLERFVQEARTASSLNHPHLVPVYEVGSDVIDGDTIHFIAMELVDGETLRERTATKALDLKRMLQVMGQVSDAVAAAHAIGITHRDLKPENIIITTSGYAKVLDFGLAKLRRESETIDEARTALRGTDPGVVLGTVGYMSPEQAQGRAADARSDVFALGCILYELTTGRRAFSGESSVDTMHRIIHSQPERIATYRPDSPLELQRIVEKALEKDPDDRYQSVKDLAVDLRRLLRNVESNPDFLTVSSGGHVAVKRQQIDRPWILIAGVAVVALVAASAVLWVLRGGGSARVPEAARIAEVSRLTSLGKVIAAAISPDAKLLAYVVSDQGQQGLWIRQIATAHDVELIPRNRVAYWGHTFRPDGGSIVFGVKSDIDPTGAFYEISILGGTPRRLVSGIDSSPSFSPDGARMSWVRADFPSPGESALMIANADGTAETTLSTRKLPFRFAPAFFVGPSWSGDGSLIAAAENRSEGAVAGRIIGFDPASGAERVLSEGWAFVGQLAWSTDGRALYAVAQREVGSNAQIWRVPLEGEARPLTSELFDHRIASLSADGKSLVSVVSDADSAIWRMPLGPSGDAVRLTQRRLDGLTGVALLPDGGVVYPSVESGRLGIIMLAPDGSAPVEITRGVNEVRYPSVPADGSFVAYLELTPAGTELRTAALNDRRWSGQPLARGIDTTPPAVSPDGEWILYTDDGVLHRVRSGGGVPVSYTLPGRVSLPAISPDGRRVAFYYLDHEGFRVGVAPFEGGGLEWSRAVEAVRYASALAWASDGKGLLLNTMPRDRANIWLLPFDGQPERITTFREHDTGYFQSSADGRTIVLARYVLVRDAVLIRNVQ